MEEWRDIEGYEGLYQVSNLGRVKSLDRVIIFKNGKKRKFYGLQLKPKKCGEYYGVSLCGKNKLIAHLVAKAFPEICGEWFEGCQVDHLDTNKLNNNALNLRVCTEKENHNNPLTRKHNSQAKLGKTPWNKGKEHSPETREKIRTVLTGKHLYDDNPNSKEIEQYTIDGKYIQSFTTLKKAAETLNLNRCSLSMCIHGKHKTCGGYVWRLKGGFPNALIG